MKYVDLKAELQWLDGRHHINSGGGFTTYDGFEAAAWIMPQCWTHPALETIHREHPYLEFPHHFGAVDLDGVNLNPDWTPTLRFRNPPPSPWRRITMHELFEAAGRSFNLWDAVAPIGRIFPANKYVPRLWDDQGIGEPGASQLFGILGTHTEGGLDADVDVYHCLLHGIGLRDSAPGGDLDEMLQMNLQEALLHASSPEVEFAPCNIWPLDHAWLYADDYDFDGIFIAGSEQLIQALLDCPELEVIESTLETDPWRHWEDTARFDQIRKNGHL